MPTISYIDNMQRILKNAKEHGSNNTNLNKTKYLFERFEKSYEFTSHSDEELAPLIDNLSNIADNLEIESKIYYYSFLARITKNSTYLEKILQMCLNEINDVGTINYIRWQCEVLVFINAVPSSPQSIYLSHLVYKRVFISVYHCVKEDLNFIDNTNRSKLDVIVMTSQFLNLNHAPTKTLLARCCTLNNIFGMNVLIINTRELITTIGKVPFYNAISGTVCEEYCEADHITFENARLGFYQSPVPMPDLDEINKIIKMVKDKKPYFIVNIGGNSIMADICSNIVPVLTIGTVPSAIPNTFSQFMTLGRKLTDGDKKWLEKVGISSKSVIECLFTSDLRQQTESYTRDDFNLPANKFLVMVVGWRLDYEIKSDFLKMMAKTFDNDICYVFVGPAKKIQPQAETDKNLREHCFFLGEQKDILAIADICDLYANPIRTGGGTSCVEAMSKGKPVVTLPNGDVGLGAGEDFHVPSYDEMAATINRYKEDKQFYEQMSEKAKVRSKTLLDTDNEFKAIVEKMINSHLFK